MVIKQVYVKNFGKLKECQFSFGVGINLISGSNESGKTTLHTFIRSMFYGMRRMRGRAAHSDTYSRYEPWENGGYYAGVLRFESGGKFFRLTRNFHKSGPQAELICETDGEKLDIEQGDLKVLLGDVSESVFENTLSIGQLKSMTDDGLVTALRDYIVNYQNSNVGDLDVEQALLHLKGQRKELERQMKEDGQELQSKIRELEGRLSYLEREKTGFDEKISEQSTSEFQEVPKSYNPLLKVCAIAILCSIIFFSMKSPLGFLTMLIGILMAVLHWYQRLQWKKEYQQKKRWNFQQLQEMLQEKQRECDNLYNELQELREQEEQIHPLCEDIAAINLALQTIEELSKNQQGKISSVLQKRTSQILAEMTDGKYTGVHISKDFKIYLDTKVSYVEPGQLSRGTLEQIYFAFRMAASEVLCQEEWLPILLDDVFVMYDEKRLERTLRWLAKCGHQVLLFSCHTREASIMDQLKIPYHKVNLEER